MQKLIIKIYFERFKNIFE